MSLENKTVVVIGGGSGIGLLVAAKAIEEGARVVIGGRGEVRLAEAVARLGERSRAHRVDTADKGSIRRFFDGVGAFDHLFISAATYALGPIDQIDDETAESPFRSKFWGQYWSVRDALPHLARDGSITLMAGAAGARPLKGASAYAACNSAIEGLGRALAVELSPIRVNTVSPGTIDGNLWRQRPAEIREAAFAAMSEISLIGRPGTEEEVADSVLFLIRNRLITGSTLYPDGGYVLR
ncbi:SDR family oxidoreductase [Rhizorhabdus histidinilytica]|uniref:NAD(P)-dependent dehydrogenase, short-chain alcohol dehydrogenase family n=1 Tax=Rhizorhabdus histidinilytica TaxID=439228 RepID=A0A1T5FHB8_9SPHN|nr:SDR family oxidoreductase [Rhizorhabdus histidinilytica]SKB95570.1 NAD(P)-dependent dehydrogenase, short-chain alcohol dehydrogenase family [Rhizorhabdus histidinilytica]